MLSVGGNKTTARVEAMFKPRLKHATGVLRAYTIEGIAMYHVYSEDYEDLKYLVQKRNICVTIQKSAEAGVAAGLSVMLGTIVAGPTGAIVGGTIGTAMAARIAQNVVSLNDLLEEAPPAKRMDIIKTFADELTEFVGTVLKNPELRFLVDGVRSPIAVVRYLVERNILQIFELKELDAILRMVML